MVECRQVVRYWRKKINIFGSERAFAEFFEVIEKNNYAKKLMAQFRKFY